jgi:hypothetical protein
MNSQVVICRLLHAGQSTTAGVSCNEARGVAVGQLFLFSVMVLFSVTMSWFSGMMFLLSVMGSMESWVVCLVKVEGSFRSGESGISFSFGTRIDVLYTRAELSLTVRFTATHSPERTA